MACGRGVGAPGDLGVRQAVDLDVPQHGLQPRRQADERLLEERPARRSARTSSASALGSSSPHSSSEVWRCGLVRRHDRWHSRRIDRRTYGTNVGLRAPIPRRMAANVAANTSATMSSASAWRGHQRPGEAAGARRRGARRARRRRPVSPARMRCSTSPSASSDSSNATLSALARRRHPTSPSCYPDRARRQPLRADARRAVALPPSRGGHPATLTATMTEATPRRGAPRRRRPARRPASSDRPIHVASTSALTTIVTMPPVEAPTGFAELGVPARIDEGLAAAGFAQPFEIQTEAIPVAMLGRDVCGRARTGSGKTLAFGVPMLARILDEAEPTPAARARPRPDPRARRAGRRGARAGRQPRRPAHPRRLRRRQPPPPDRHAQATASRSSSPRRCA